MNLLIKFPNSSESFAHGVEFGRLLEKIERGDDPISNNGFPVRIENKNLLIETCKKFDYIPLFGSIFCKGEWVEFLGIKKTTSDQ